MSLPAFLYPGLVSIYGAGSTTGISGIVPPDANFLFGLIDQTWDSGQGTISVGQSVMYNIKDVVGIMVYDWRYTILPENKIILIEEEPA